MTQHILVLLDITTQTLQENKVLYGDYLHHLVKLQTVLIKFLDNTHIHQVQMFTLVLTQKLILLVLFGQDLNLIDGGVLEQV